MSEFMVKLEEARQRLPLKRLMEQRGKSPVNGKWKSFPKCPYCQHDNCAGVFPGKRGELFKCQHTACSSGTQVEGKAWDEVGFLAHELGLSWKEAAITLMKEAGVWKEQEANSPSVLPGQSRRKFRPPSEVAVEDEDLIRQCVEVVRSEGKASVALLQRRLRLGYTRAARIVDEMEKRGMVGPAKGAEPRDILMDLSEPAAVTDLPDPQSGPRSSAGDEAPRSAADPASLSAAGLESESSGECGGQAVPGVPPIADGTSASPGEIPTQSPGEASPAVTDRTLQGEQEPAVTDRTLGGDEREAGLDKFVTYLKMAEKRTVCFLDAEVAVGCGTAVWMMEQLELRGVVGKANKAGVRKVLLKKAPPTPPARSLEPPPAAPPGGSSGGNGSPPGSGSDGPPPEPNGEADKRNPLTALRWFYERLTLSEADVQLLWTKRGLTPSTCAALGYRSNPKANQALLEEMANLFPPNTLIESGLWSEGTRPGQAAKPNPQFHGMALVAKRDENGKKVKDEDGETVLECVWTQPILIPYFNERGELVHLRPHKGMMREKSPRFYSIPLPPNTTPAFAVITEGEFKAGGLMQVFGGKMAYGALPGITMAKPLFGDVEEWLESLTLPGESPLRQVIIGYDNEDKGTPGLPGYTAEDWQRHDTQVYARYLARELAKVGYDTRICVLPNEWRIKGKADWDGRLAQSVAGHAPDEWPKLAARIQAEWAQVVQTSVPIHEMWQAGFFDSKEEKQIRSRLEKISYEPKLPVGGNAEQTISRRLRRLAAKTRGNPRRLPAKMGGFLTLLASKYTDLKGGYYTLKNLREKSQEEWQTILHKASSDGDMEIKRACEIALRGIPERISDFYMKPHYVLRRLNGTRDRLVTLHNIHGVDTPLLSLPSAAFSQPSKWREWLLDSTTGATWEAGERELQRLHADVGREVAYKDVGEVAVRGYHADSKCWYFADVTYTPEGSELFADKKGILWHANLAYKLSDTDHEGQHFRHGEPRMHPAVKATDEELALLFQELSAAMKDTIGDYSGWLAIGVVLSCGAGPEIYEHFVGFPGLWLHGETQQGKSSVARWLMRIWGVLVQAGIPLKDSTKVGLSIALQQYSNMMVWLEEFQPTAPDWMTEKLKNIYDRASGSKKVFDEGERKILAGAIVTGVATSSDAQVKNRYAHVMVSEANRKANHFDWFETHSPSFYRLGRYILQHRKEFAALVVPNIRKWLASQTILGIDPRARIVYGSAYASFAALATLLKTHGEKELEAFHTFLIAYCRLAVAEVREQVNVNQFWREVLDALKDDAFGETPSDRQRIFKVVENPKAVSPVTEMQLAWGAEKSSYVWPSYLLYFQPGPVIDQLRRYKRLQGRDLALDRNDLRAQMQTRDYWVKPKTDAHRQKFGHGSRTPESCWCIDLDKHELGFRPVSDEEFKTSLYQEGLQDQGMFLETAEWTDPRRGDLFALVDALRSQREGGSG